MPLLLALAALTTASAAPVQLQHQVRVLDAAGGPVNGQRELTVVLYDAAVGGDVAYSETFSTTLDDGYAALVLGGSDALDDSVFAQPLWAQTLIDGAPIGQRQPLTSTPSAATVRGLTAEQLVGQTQIILQGDELTGSNATLDGWLAQGDALVLGAGGWGDGLTDLVVPEGETLTLQPGVHRYNNVTVNGVLQPRAYYGVDGGVIDLQARGTVIVNGRIDVSGLGYRGGRAEYAQLSNQLHGTNGQPGESYQGWLREGGEIRNSNVAGGGGGGLYDAGNYGCAGGGGGYGSAGTTRDCPANGGLDATGGQPYGDAALTVLHLGSGGGASGSDEDHLGRGGHGGRGGGAIRIQADAIDIRGELRANGANGTNATVSNNGGGGGGSGGSIHLRARDLQVSGNLRAVGGAGGAQVGGGGVGGPGGVGRIRLDGAVLEAGGSITPAPGLIDQDAAYALGGGHYGVYTSPVLSFEGSGRWSAVHAFTHASPHSTVRVELRSGPDESAVSGDDCYRPVAASGAVLAEDDDRFARVRITGWDDSDDLSLHGIQLDVAR